MDTKDLVWQIFSCSGDINYYLLYNELSNKKGGKVHGPDKNKSAGAEEHILWRLR